MELSELAAYARQKFQMSEQHPYSDFPEITALMEPQTNRQVALLIREWDPEAGFEIERCDLRCGELDLSQITGHFLTRPFYKKGKDWIGIIFDSETDIETVLRLFDQAVAACEKWNFSVVLKDGQSTHSDYYQASSIPSPQNRHHENSNTLIHPASIHNTENKGQEHVATTQSHSQSDSIISKTSLEHTTAFTLSPDSAPVVMPDTASSIPPRILEMRKLYEFGNDSFVQKCKNFYRQGKFMENYTDDAPWNGRFRHFFPTYHDLNLPQLRGYFTWRTQVRAGNVRPIAVSFAYIYIYELLNGIGTSSPEDSLQKLSEFDQAFSSSEPDAAALHTHIHDWMFEFAILHDMPSETIRSYADTVVKQDQMLTILRDPASYTDEEVTSALCAFGKKSQERSPVLTKSGERGRHLFAEVWRYACDHYQGEHDEDLFTACFGRLLTYNWYPLGNAVYYEKQPHADMEFALDAVRSFRCQKGFWYTKHYEKLYFDKDRFQSLLHAADRLLRIYLGTGHRLKEQPDDAWAVPFVNAVIEEDKKAVEEASRPHISIDFSSLGKIRADAAVTRDSLLTNDEVDPMEDISEDTSMEETQKPSQLQDMILKPQTATASPSSVTLTEDSSHNDVPSVSNANAMTDDLHDLSPQEMQILQKLLNHEDISGILKAGHLMPSVVADTINEAFFDDIGDSVLECTDDQITLVEDYRKDLEDLLSSFIK